MNVNALIEFFKKYDFSFILINLAVFLFGIFNLYSATNDSAKASLSGLYKTQIIYFGISILVSIGVSLVQPKNFYRVSYFVYIFNVVLLLFVLFVGDTGMGARRWLAVGSIRIQPSELMKISLILCLSRFF